MSTLPFVCNTKSTNYVQKVVSGKFVSNKVEVLQSILEADRKDDLKNIDINSDSDLPTERALGINWDIENDKLGFKVNLGDNHPQEEECSQ